MIPVPSEFRGLEPSKYVMCLPCFPSPDRDARRFAQRQPGGSAAEATEVRISFFRSKIAALALLASKIEHRVVVGPDPLIVGSSAAGHHHILDADHPIPPSGARPEPPRGGTGAEDGRQGVSSARGRRAATREAFVTAIRDFAVMGSECRGLVTCHSHEA
jgi:hypothetical protein